MTGRVETLYSGFKLSQEVLEKVGISDPAAVTAELAVRLGARRVLETYRASGDMGVEEKEDTSLRIRADTLSGSVIIRMIKRRHPHHEINEEETGVYNKEGEKYKWYVDPLDGTWSFARRQPYSCVGVAVYEDDQPLAAAICQPFERQLLVAQKNTGAYSFSLDKGLNISSEAARLHVSTRDTLEKSTVFVDGYFDEVSTSRKTQFIQKLVEQSGSNLGIRMTGSNIDQQRQVALGGAELSLTDSVGGFYDLAIGGLIIEEAGGKFTDIWGNPVTEATRVAIGTNGILHEKILSSLQECYRNY